MSDSSSAVCMRTETLMAVGANDFLYLAVLQQREQSLPVLMVFGFIKVL